MSIAELVPRWPGLPDPTGETINAPSLRGRLYRWRGSDRSLDLDAILSTRGIGADEVEAFLRPKLARHMPSPMLLEGMRAASSRIALAVMRRERILVFGDYDVDGATSTALMVRWLRSVGHDARYYIPDRMADGYGPSEGALASADVSACDLLITVDCGTASAALLEGLDCDVVVIDHHRPQGDLPNVVAVVNPHREDCSSGLGMLCACALVFLTVVQAQRQLADMGFDPTKLPRLKSFLDLVALATVADVVPLVGPSRLFVSAGLAVMREAPSPGIAALISVAGVDEITSGKMGFALGPRINAGGRVGGGSGRADGALGVELLLSSDVEQAAPIAQRLNELNRQRQEVEETCLNEALELAAEQVQAGAELIAVASHNWHPGVVGIVAGRLRERFDLPALVGVIDGGLVKGSGRSVSGFDLGGLIIDARASGRLVSGGGHAMACGFGCQAAEWDSFVQFMRSRAKWSPEPLVIDAEARLDRLLVEQVESLGQLQPLGQGMPSVKVLIENFVPERVMVMKGRHIKLIGPRLSAVWWRAVDEGYGDMLQGLVGQSVALVGDLAINDFNGRRSVEMTLSDILP